MELKKIFNTLILLFVKSKFVISCCVCIFFLYNYVYLRNRITNKIENYQQKRHIPQIFCIVLTVEKNFNSKTKLMFESWVKKCDNYKFISTISEKYFNNKLNQSDPLEINIGFNVVQPPNYKNESYSKLTEKVFETFKYIYDKYPNYDFYLKADDDTYIFVDNLRLFLTDKDRSKPATFGYDFHVHVDYGYHSGGAGYVLTNQAMSRLVNYLKQNSTQSNELYQLEDIDMGNALRKLHVYPQKSVDDFGRERFHPLTLDDHYKGIFNFIFEHYLLNNHVEITKVFSQTGFMNIHRTLSKKESNVVVKHLSHFIIWRMKQLER